MTQTSLLTKLVASTNKPFARHFPTAFPCRAQPVHIGFLFNHEQGHQLAHSAPILAAIAAKKNDAFHLHAFISNEARRRELQAFLPEVTWRLIKVHLIPCSAIARWAEKAVGGAVPVQRIGALIRHRSLLREMDVLVAPETTCTLLRTDLGCRNTKFIYTQHGAGDRAVGFKKVIKEFDHVLVPGRKVRDRMLDRGIVRKGGYSVVGYPKFDTVLFSQRCRLFPNDNPTVLYNPHFHPALSSWYQHGLNVLGFFAQNSCINLIFAPHVMLFSRMVHASTSPPRLRLSGHVPAHFRHLPNIIVDEGSARSMDMTYTRAADIYLGDVSSQVYEAISKPKPCIFIKTSAGIDWRDDPNYAHWHLGKVIGSAGDLGRLLNDMSWFDSALKDRQTKAFHDTFGDAPFGAAERAANAIMKIADVKCPVSPAFPTPCVKQNGVPIPRGDFHA